MSRSKIIVVGGGASGLFAAGKASERGADVIILEKMKRPARKLIITGKGRCNITNLAPLDEFMSHFGRTSKFIRPAFNALFNVELKNFLHNLGLEMVDERGGRVFTKTGKASDVLKVLLVWLKKLNVQILTSTPVQKLIIEDNKVIGVQTAKEKYFADAVILAMGGASYPATGSSGDGYILAERIGHSIVPIQPALVPFDVISLDSINGLNKLHLKNINCQLFVDGKKKAEAFGELEFHETGVTGPTVLNLSFAIVSALKARKKISLQIDFKPALDSKKLHIRLLRDIEKRGKEALQSVLRGVMPAQLVAKCLSQNPISGAKLANTLSQKERKKIVHWLKNFSVDIDKPRPFEEAIVTAGGVNTREIDPNTMESKIIQNLYMVGELLDIQADTGGFNLQAAFSMGWLAGIASVEKLKELKPS